MKCFARVINDTEEGTPDGSNMEISRPDLSKNELPQPIVRKRGSVLSKD